MFQKPNYARPQNVRRHNIKDMQKLFFYINGSGSPFWLDEKKDINGNYYYEKLFWPENSSDEFKTSWSRISILYETYKNPIDFNFPSLWRQEMCDLFNNSVTDFLKLSESELKEFTLINKYNNINQDKRLIVYRQNIIKSHLEYNKTLYSEKELEDYFKYKNEIKSVLTTELPFEEIIRIEQCEFDTFNKITLCFGNYNNFQISICPYSFKSYLTDINIGGHYAVYNAIRINRQDIFVEPEKLIRIAKKLNS